MGCISGSSGEVAGERKPVVRGGGGGGGDKVFIVLNKEP
jgi:hypothetical protein